MSDTIEIKVPDIGGFQDVPVIDVLVKPGDTVKANDGLVTLESDKASMDVPTTTAGIVREVRLKAGDKVSEGTTILTLEPAARTNGAATIATDGPVKPQRSAPATPPEVPSANASDTAGRIVELTVPDIGGFKDVPVIDVLIRTGDEIVKDASLVTLESDKASMDVPASAGGTIVDVRIKTGDKVSEGTVIATVRTTAMTTAPPKPASATATATPAAPASTPAPAAPSIRTAALAPDGETHASPSIRRFARELGVELRNVRASGPNGRITRDDVQNFVKAALRTGAPAGGAGLNLAPWPVVDFAQFGEIERKPLSRIQKISGPNLHRNWVMIPHVTQHDDADVTELEAFRKQLNDEQRSSGLKVTMLAFLIKAAVTTLKTFPQFNASLDGDELVFKKYYNIGFAADTPNGLVVPVVKNADRKGIVEIARENAELAAKARDGKLSITDMQGGTFTISSLGSIGGTYFSPIINAPEVAILGACRAAMRPFWDGSQFVPRLMQPLSLSYDHRVIDGAAAARFITHLAAELADLRRILL